MLMMMTTGKNWKQFLQIMTEIPNKYVVLRNSYTASLNGYNTNNCSFLNMGKVSTPMCESI
jgi:hypothetical protein